MLEPDGTLQSMRALAAHGHIKSAALYQLDRVTGEVILIASDWDLWEATQTMFMLGVKDLVHLSGPGDHPFQVLELARLL